MNGEERSGAVRAGTRAAEEAERGEPPPERGRDEEPERPKEGDREPTPGERLPGTVGPVPSPAPPGPLLPGRRKRDEG